MKPSKIAQISKETRKWVAMYLGHKKQKTEQEGSALESLIDSLNKTASYINEIRISATNESNERNMELSQMWSDTSILVRPYKPALADKCFFKGLYWADHEQFSDEEIESLGISISAMKKEVSAAIKST